MGLRPSAQATPAGSTMIATDVTAPFMAPFKLTFFVALFLGIPYILHQLWGFISPALYKHERRVAVPLLISSIFLFYLGVAFAFLSHYLPFSASSPALARPMSP